METFFRKIIVLVVLVGAAVGFYFFSTGDMTLNTYFGSYPVPGGVVIGGCFFAGVVLGMVLRGS